MGPDGPDEPDDVASGLSMTTLPDDEDSLGPDRRWIAPPSPAREGPAETVTSLAVARG